MEEYSLRPIAIVENSINESTDYNEIKKRESIIHVFQGLIEGIYNIEACDYLDIFFVFNKSEDFSMEVQMHDQKRRGVFASRSPNRPNSIGFTTVKLLRRENNKLFVSGLDAINNTPVIDIKSTDTSIFELHSNFNKVHQALLKSRPRIEIDNLVKGKNSEQLLIKAAQLHGHYCPGLAMGVMASCYALNKMNVFSDGMEDLLAITEINSCFTDGIQFTTGCSLGNNSLIYKDLGKTAFTLTRRDGNGIRIRSKNEAPEMIKTMFPEFNRLYQEVVGKQNHDAELMERYKKKAVDRAFATLSIPFEELFETSEVTTQIPEYARVEESYFCEKCGESLMSTKTIKKGGHTLCFDCSYSDYYILNGNGISTKHVK